MPQIQFDSVFTKCSYSSTYLNLKKCTLKWTEHCTTDLIAIKSVAQQTDCNHKQLLLVDFRKQWTTIGSTNFGSAWFNDSSSKLLPRMIVNFFNCYLMQRLKLIKLILN